jgi:hypothetical protein
MRPVIYEDAGKESAGDDFAAGAGEGETQTSVRVGRRSAQLLVLSLSP